MKSDPEMLKALTEKEILSWLLRVFQVALKFGKTPKDWQTGVNILIFKKENRKQSMNYRKISRSLPEKVDAKCLERKCRVIVDSKLLLFESQHYGPNFYSKANL